MSNKNRDTKPEVESIGQAAERFAPEFTKLNGGAAINKWYKTAFIEGANWQKEQYTERVEGETLDNAEEDYYPISCNHKKQNGLSAYDLQSAFTSSGGIDIIREFNVWVCLKCGEIKISAKQDVGDKIGYIQQEFSIYMPNAVAAIAKNCNYMNKETDGYIPIVRQSQQPVTTPSTSTTIEALADKYIKENYPSYSFPDILESIFKAAYSQRDKEQAGAVEMIKARIDNYELEAMHDILSPTGIKNNKIRITELTNLLKEIQK